MKSSVIFRLFTFKSVVVGLLFAGLPWTTQVCAQESDGQAVEIFSGGKHYDSLEGYRKKGEEEKNSIGLENSGMDFAEVREMFDEAVRSSTNPLDLKFDPTKMKTINIHPAGGSEPAESSASTGQEPVKDPFVRSYNLLNKLGPNTAVKEIVSEFAVAPTAGREKKVVRSDDLERVLRDSFGQTNQPLLLISDDNKLRVMTLDPKNPDTPDSGQPAKRSGN